MPDNIGGIPFFFDEEQDKQLFGSLFSNGLSKPNFNKNRPAPPSGGDVPSSPDFPDPFNRKDKMLFSDIDMEASEDPKMFPYKIIFRKSGVDVFKDYNSDSQKNTPLDKQLIIFYEIESDKRSNFFGTACRVKMGNAYRELLNDLINGNKKIKVDGGLGAEWSLNGWARQIARTTKIDFKVLLNAVNLELSYILKDDKLFNTIFSLNNKLANWIYKGSEKMESWKLTDVNYEFKRKYNFGPVVLPYRPIIPVPFSAIDEHYSSSEEYVANDKGFDDILNFASNFDKVLFNAQTLTAILTPMNPIDDILVLGLRSFFQENLPKNMQRIFNKIKAVINQITDFISAIKGQIAHQAALFNAFLCGLVNGLISLLQLAVLLVGFVVDNIPFLEGEKAFSKKAFDKRQAQFEFVEDIVDTLTDNISKIFKGLVKFFINFKDDFSRFIIEMTHKLSNVSEYLVAFTVGAIVFELISDAIAAFFTGGTSAVAGFVAKISRASSKLSKAATKIYRKAATSTIDILNFIKKEFDAFIDAIKNGKFVEWLKEKFFRLIGEVVEELVIYGISELSIIAIDYRKSLANPKHNGNIAVFEFYDKNGVIQTKAFTTEVGRRFHAENIGLQWFEKQKIPLNNVITIYSELEPCDLNKHQCKTLIKDNFKKANTQYSFPYPGDSFDLKAASIRKKSIKSRTKILKNLLK